MNKILITGKPGVGKTTLVLKIAEKLSGKKIGGFYTEEIRVSGDRVGFGIKTFDGKEGILSHVKIKSDPKVGKYGVDIGSFERFGVKAVEDALTDADIMIIDEIGKMELFSCRFKDAVMRCFDSDKPVIATIMQRPNEFADSIKNRPDVEIFEVTYENRGGLVDNISRKVGS